MSKRRSTGGFTLIEVVVVVAVIAILAAILTPFITKYISDSQVARSKNEAQVIAAAVTNAYKDLGRWPNRINATTDYGGLYTSTVAPTAALFGTATGWTAAGAGWNQLNTHLVTNGHGYPATGDNKWAGPYSTQLPNDPWGRPYVINAANFMSTAVPPIPVWVLSAGVNGVIETNIAAATTVTGGDDVGVRIR
ncbi:MAG: prepilin-type N-terminal cleavage/methylation domain-containing protein [Deltaproteobacteria bacterium]|nr:prepilin-type N-terminal cleavage/methylation domain-containing protein [Deltaproteobacteria bacterium]